MGLKIALMFELRPDWTLGRGMIVSFYLKQQQQQQQKTHLSLKTEGKNKTEN